MGREANAIADLSARLAALSGLPNGEAERDMVDVNACIEEVLEAMRAERGTRIAKRLGDIPDVFASRTEIRLLLAQILDNALRAVEGLDSREPTIKVDTAERSGEVLVTVIDNGDGIAPGAPRAGLPALLHLARRRDGAGAHARRRARPALRGRHQGELARGPRHGGTHHAADRDARAVSAPEPTEIAPGATAPSRPHPGR